MADQKTVWLYIFTDKNDYDGPAFIAFAKKEDALAHAADVIKGIAVPEQTRYEWRDGDPNPEELAEIVKAVTEGRHEDAISLWGDYSSEYDTDETVTVQSIQFFG